MYDGLQGTYISLDTQEKVIPNPFISTLVLQREKNVIKINIWRLTAWVYLHQAKRKLSAAQGDFPLWKPLLQQIIYNQEIELAVSQG